MLTVATAGRTVAWEGDDAWRRRGHGPARATPLGACAGRGSGEVRTRVRTAR